MNRIAAAPTVFRISQAGSADRRRVRRASIEAQRRLYELTEWKPWEHPSWKDSDPQPRWMDIERPRIIREVPKEQSFGPRKWGVLIAGNLVTKVNQKLGMAFNPRMLFGGGRLEGFRDYADLFELFLPPSFAAARWQSDLDFGNQRLNGCNPNVIQRHIRDAKYADIEEAAQVWLREIAPGQSFDKACEQGRIFIVDYAAATLIAQHVPPEVSMCAPHALFYASPQGNLLPLAIRLWPDGHLGADGQPVPNVPITPASGHWSWAVAKGHFQSVDAGYHEAITHLHDTHLILELTAVSAYRTMHVNHPIMQLLVPHFLDNLPLNKLARDTLLRKNGDIDAAIGVGAKGAIELVAAVWGSWDFQQKDPRVDFVTRGVDDEEVLSHYWYRDDALRILDATDDLMRDLVASWYGDDDAVRADTEVQAFAALLSGDHEADDPSSLGGRLKGFPSAFETMEQLALTLSQLVFRASAQHAAVNNGQYDRYGWPLYSPTTVNTLLTADGKPDLRLFEGARLTEHDFWQSMPDRSRSLGQLNMARVLSAPTYTSMVRTGDARAFDPVVSPQAARAVQVYRERLASISAALRRRNAVLDAPYTYLDPYNISRSIEIEGRPQARAELSPPVITLTRVSPPSITRA